MYYTISRAFIGHTWYHCTVFPPDPFPRTVCARYEKEPHPKKERLPMLMTRPSHGYAIVCSSFSGAHGRPKRVASHQVRSQRRFVFKRVTRAWCLSHHLGVATKPSWLLKKFSCQERDGQQIVRANPNFLLREFSSRACLLSQSSYIPSSDFYTPSLPASTTFSTPLPRSLPALTIYSRSSRFTCPWILIAISNEQVALLEFSIYLLIPNSTHPTFSNSRLRHYPDHGTEHSI